MKMVEFEELMQTESALTSPISGLTKELLNDVSVVLVVNAGHIELKAQQLFALKAGEILSMQQTEQQAMQLKYGEHVIAEGELVVVDSQLGFRVVRVLEEKDAL